MTPERFLNLYRPNSYPRSVSNLVDFLEAVSVGENLWHEGKKKYICYSSMDGLREYQALKALGWSVGCDYGSYGSEWVNIYSPHPTSNKT